MSGVQSDILLARQAARRRAEAKRAVSTPRSVGFVTHNLDAEVGKTVHEKGYLVKQGEKVKSWKRRYFVLTGTMLRWCVLDVAPQAPPTHFLSAAAACSKQQPGSAGTRTRRDTEGGSRRARSSALG